MADVDALMGVGTAEEKALLDKYLREDCATVIQKHARRYIQRVKILELMEATYEKILDPRRKCYFYYNINTDRSSWKKPALLLKADLSRIAPTYTLDQAATKIQSLCRCRPALKRTRNLYKLFVKEMVDQAGAKYYYNPLTARSMWELPSFMGGMLDGHVYGKKKEEAKEEEKDEDSDDDDDDDSDDGSNLSDDSSLVRQRRREARKFPRSKAQAIVDACEDNQVRRRAVHAALNITSHLSSALTHTLTPPHALPQALTELDLTGIGATRFTSRIYDLTALTTLNLSHNKLTALSRNIQYLDSLEVLDVSHNFLSTFPREIEELQVSPCCHPGDAISSMDSYLSLSRLVPFPVPCAPRILPSRLAPYRPVPRVTPRPVPCVLLRRTCA